MKASLSHYCFSALYHCIFHHFLTPHSSSKTKGSQFEKISDETRFQVSDHIDLASEAYKITGTDKEYQVGDLSQFGARDTKSLSEIKQALLNAQDCPS